MDQTEKDHTEKRQSERRPITRTIYLATGVSAPLQCQMLDVSQTGARIRVGDPRTAPQEFLVQIGVGLTRWCQVIWRSDTELGIKFVEPPASLKKTR